MLELCGPLLLAAALAQIPASAPTSAPAGASSAKTTSATEDPYAAYAKGQFAEAFEGFANLQVRRPHDVGLMLNIGASLYRLKDYAGAQKALALAAERGNAEERAQALYDMGNCAFQQDHFDEAAKHFQEALALDPEDTDAQHNLEAAQRALRKQQQQAEQQGEPNKSDPQSGDPNGSARSPQQAGEPNATTQQASDPNDTHAGDANAADPADPNHQSTGHRAVPQTDPNATPAAKQPPAAPPERPDGQAAAGTSGGAKPDAATAENPAAAASSPDAPSQPGQMTRARAERLLDALGETRPHHDAPPDGPKGRAAGKDY